MTEDACRKLMALAGRDLDELVRSARREFQPVPLGIAVSTAFDNRIERTRTANVLAVLPGQRPPALRPRSCSTPPTTTTSACAPTRPPGEDAIYNGAEDNASGVALMLERGARVRRPREGAEA